MVQFLSPTREGPGKRMASPWKGITFGGNIQKIPSEEGNSNCNGLIWVFATKRYMPKMKQ